MHLISTNRGPSLLATDPHATLTLLDSEMTGRAPNQPGIECQGNLFIRNLSATGFTVPAVHCRGSDVSGSDYAEFVPLFRSGDTTAK